MGKRKSNIIRPTSVYVLGDNRRTIQKKTCANGRKKVSVVRWNVIGESSNLLEVDQWEQMSFLVL